MKTAKIIGLETEYALLAKGEAANGGEILFKNCHPPYSARWDYQPERPWCDARGFVPAAAVPTLFELPLELLQDPTADRAHSTDKTQNSGEDIPVQVNPEETPNYMLTNGARFYLDHTHPEWSTPECESPLEAVKYDKAGEVWINRLVNQINSNREEKNHISVYKNNVDTYGNTYGCHENYLMDSRTYTSLFDQTAHRLYMVLIPFLVSRQVLCGSGKIAPINSTGEMGFHISQRADFFESIIGLPTTSNRPIINTRDEPLANPVFYRRLHVIGGDSNMSEYSTLLKVGTTALVLEMIAHDRLRLDLALADPLHAIKEISRDPTCKRKVELETGKRLITAIDIQRRFIEAAHRYLEEIADNSYRRKIWHEWCDSVEKMAQDPLSLSSKLDWVIKYEFFQVKMEKNRWTWASPEVRELDIKYHQIDPGKSLFHLMRKAGLIDVLLNEKEIQQATIYPPQNTRAFLRTACLDRFNEQIHAVNWDTLVFSDKQGRTYRWRWGDPLYDEKDNREALPEADDILNFLFSLKKNTKEEIENGTNTNQTT